MKEIVQFKLMALLIDGYVYSDQHIVCPFCGLRFSILLDPKDRSGHDENSALLKRKALTFFREKIIEDHLEGHSHERFMMK